MIRDKLTPLVVTTEHQPDRLVGAGDSPRFSLRLFVLRQQLGPTSCGFATNGFY